MSRSSISRVRDILKFSRNYSTKLPASESSQTNFNADGEMGAWQIRSYGDISQLQFTNNVKIPKISSPSQVLVKVHAASVNPLDVDMIGGFGRNLFNFFRSSKTEFPMTLGRDFSGVVVNKGAKVGGISIGEPVWGVLMPYVDGSHAEYVVVDKKSVTSRPKNFTHIEAASILYAGLTAYSGLMFNGGLARDGMKGKRILVLGASGGVGSIAVQILKAGGATVISSCSSDAKPLVKSLGVDIILERSSADFEKQLVDAGPYDIILDCAGQGPANASKYKWKYKKYVTFTTPLLGNLDERGIIGGLFKSFLSIASSTVTSVFEGRSTRWAFIKPTTEGIEHLKKLAEQNQLKPVINSIFPFEKTFDAYIALTKGHLRGKIVIDVIGGDSAKDHSS